MFCSQCGATTAVDWRFCRLCGHTLSADTTGGSSVKDSEKTSPGEPPPNNAATPPQDTKQLFAKEDNLILARHLIGISVVLLFVPSIWRNSFLSGIFGGWLAYFLATVGIAALLTGGLKVFGLVNPWRQVFFALLWIMTALAIIGAYIPKNS